MQTLTLDPDLIQRCQRGDRVARRGVYDALRGPLLRFLLGLRLGLRPADLEDALQETFLRVFNGLNKVDPARSLESWALGVARHVALDLRWRGDRAEPGDVDALPGDDAAVDDALLTDERQRTVLAALRALPLETRSVLVLRHQHGVTMQALADALDCSLPTARARLRAANAQLKLELSRRGEEGDR